VIGNGALPVAASGILAAAHAARRAGEPRRKIEQPEESRMLREPCRNVFMQCGRWIVI
jgi:hypothetical protein